jgi:hypothetical protein
MDGLREIFAPVQTRQLARQFNQESAPVVALCLYRHWRNWRTGAKRLSCATAPVCVSYGSELTHCILILACHAATADGVRPP